MSSDKPSTSEIIEELQSISSFLTEPNSSTEEVPVLTVIADPEGHSSPVDTSEQNIKQGTEENLEPDLVFEDTEPTQDNNKDEEQLADETHSVQGEEIPTQLSPDQDQVMELKAAYEAELSPDKVPDKAPEKPSSSEVGVRGNSDDEPPGQTSSLFDETLESSSSDDSPQKLDDVSDSSMSSSEVTEDKGSTSNQKVASKPEKHSGRPVVKARGENPFLPPHIRKQLGKHKQAPAPKEELWPKKSTSNNGTRAESSKVEIQGDLLEGFSTQNESEPLTNHTGDQLPNNIDLDQVVEELVKDLLPKLEDRLKQELSKKLVAWKEEH